MRNLNEPICMKRHTSLCLAVASLLALGLSSALADDAPDASKLPPASTKTGVTYENDIKPMFEKSCFKCHGPDRQRGKLRLDSLEATIKGGKNSKDVVAGKSAESNLIFAVAHVGDDDMKFMPPPQDKSHVAPLTKDQVGLLRAWIDQGAK